MKFEYLVLIAVALAIWGFKQLMFEIGRRLRRNYYRNTYLKSEEWQRKRYVVLKRDNARDRSKPRTPALLPTQSYVTREETTTFHETPHVTHEVREVTHEVADVMHEPRDVRHETFNVSDEPRIVTHEFFDVTHVVSNVTHETSRVAEETRDVTEAKVFTTPARSTGFQDSIANHQTIRMSNNKGTRHQVFSRASRLGNCGVTK